MPTSNPPPPPERALDAVERQALAWVRRIAARELTPADGAALKRWCREAPAHAAAFAAAHRSWEQLRAAGELSAARQPAPPRMSTAAAVATNWPRRAFLGSAVGATAALAAVAVIHPPLDLWPSADELRADYRTAIGEQRRVALGDDVTIELNTRTSVALWSGEGPAAGIDLIAGEAAVDMLHAQRLFAVAAGAARMQAQNARFEVRRVPAGVCVTCLEGRVQVLHALGAATLASRQQLVYDDKGLGRILAIDPARVSAWREGFLRFVDTPLGEVVDEINRYRRGRVMLVNSGMAARPVTGRFQLDALDKGIAQIQRSLGLAVRSLPGGVVLLS